MKILYFGILIFITLANTSYSQEKKVESPPNIVFILADDLGWADLPMYGNEFNEAPNLKNFASQGVQFMNAYAANPVCSPTRASIQTGQYPARIGINDFLPGHWRPHEELTVPSNKTQYLPLNYETIGEAMKKLGYATGYFGKWHLGHNPEHYPDKQGYDESVVFKGGPYFDFTNQLFPTKEFSKEIVLSEALTDLSLEFIDDNKERPFFLFLSHYDVHVQLDADSTLIQKYLQKPKVGDYPGNAIYAAMIENLDKSVGRIMKKLESLDLDDNTLLVFFSDNGGLISRYDEIPLLAKEKLPIYEGDSLQYIASSNKPLRAEKGTVFEGGIRVPMIVKWSGKTHPGTKSESLISSIDFFPTFVDAANGDLPKEQIIDGKSIVPEIKGKDQNAERVLYWHYPVYHHDIPASVVRKGNWKLIQFMNDDHLELYNLDKDIGESINLVVEYPEKAEELLHLLKNWRENVNAAMPDKNPHFNGEKRYNWGKHPGVDAMLEGE